MATTPNLPAVACDVCPEPGSCCKNLYLSNGSGPLLSFWADENPHPRMAALVKLAHLGLPFLPNEGEEGEHEGRRYTHFRVSCPELRKDGRCGIYQDRPQLCRDYKPGTDELCVYGRKQK